MPTRRQIMMLMATGTVASALSPLSALAHHGFTGRYDDARPIYVEGTVLAASFRRPHPVIKLRVDEALRTPVDLPEGEEFADILEVREADRGRVIDIEYPPVGLFFGLEGRIKAGDRLATIVYQNCRPPHQLRGQWVRLPDGTAVVRRGRVQTEVSG